MSEFKFSCPNCQQNIQATSEYSGHQINCPSCQTLLVVPPAPDAPGHPPAPSGPRLSMAASTPPGQPSPSATAAASFYTGKPVHKKKPKTGLIVGLSLGAVAIAAAIYFWPEMMKKVSHGNQEIAAAAQVDTNTPPPPPPELTTEEILEKVGETYKGLTDYAAKAQTICDIDMSAVVPGQKNLRMTANSTLQLGRTNNYRLEWDENAGGKEIKGAAWSSGKGNFVGYGPIPPSKVKNRQLAMAPAASAFILSSGIAELFFSDTNSVATMTKDFTKTNGSSPNGQPCYELTGEVTQEGIHSGLILWIDKSTFLIAQVEGILDGKTDEAALKKLPSSERGQATIISKLKGTITETYSNIQTNQNLLASAFETAYKPTGAPAAPRARRASSMAGQLTQPRRGNQQPQ
jgi:hypothetical protein